MFLCVNPRAIEFVRIYKKYVTHVHFCARITLEKFFFIIPALVLYSRL